MDGLDGLFEVLTGNDPEGGAAMKGGEGPPEGGAAMEEGEGPQFVSLHETASPTTGHASNVHDCLMQLAKKRMRMFPIEDGAEWKNAKGDGKVCKIAEIGLLASIRNPNPTLWNAVMERSREILVDCSETPSTALKLMAESVAESVRVMSPSELRTRLLEGWAEFDTIRNPTYNPENSGEELLKDIELWKKYDKAGHSKRGRRSEKVGAWALRVFSRLLMFLSYMESQVSDGGATSHRKQIQTRVLSRWYHHIGTGAKKFPDTTERVKEPGGGGKMRSAKGRSGAAAAREKSSDLESIIAGLPRVPPEPTYTGSGAGLFHPLVEFNKIKFENQGYGMDK